mmetsp:Transcript_53257/g.142530  ORF Transcript_53257/g.142530 Transcript_53257/m.142530 type:complete len:107 (-) Transcript_53257:1218-1538(-)
MATNHMDLLKAPDILPCNLKAIVISRLSVVGNIHAVFAEENTACGSPHLNILVGRRGAKHNTMVQEVRMPLTARVHGSRKICLSRRKLVQLMEWRSSPWQWPLGSH